MADVCVLIPTYNRADALAITLTSLCFQETANFEVVVSDQSAVAIDEAARPLATPVRLLRSRGINVKILRNLPRQGMAQQRQFLLEQCNAPRSLFLDDDVVLEPFVIHLLQDVLQQQECGFVGNAVIGLSYVEDVRPHEQAVECINGKVQPERVLPGSDEWDRHRLHNAANLLHVQQAVGASREKPVAYKVAWVGGCVMYDTAKLRAVGGFEFWRELPSAHCGEDVLAQLRVAARFGGCGVMPSGAYHQELETTVNDRRVNAPEKLRI